MRPEVRSGAAVCFPLQLLVDGGCASSRPQVPGAAHLLGPARCVRCRAVAPSAISWVICWAALNFSLNFSLPGHRIPGSAVAKGSGVGRSCEHCWEGAWCQLRKRSDLAKSTVWFIQQSTFCSHILPLPWRKGLTDVSRALFCCQASPCPQGALGAGLWLRPAGLQGRISVGSEVFSSLLFF